jgi:tripartite-type tricarboxylate transporter receptor subunit TctC
MTQSAATQTSYNFIARQLPALLTALFAASLMSAATIAQAWTDKPVKLLVPAPAGGTMDVVARIVATQLSADIGQPVVVDNKPGAGGGIAVQAMLAAPADGQTIMVTASNVLTEIPHVMKTGFDPLKDVKPIATLARASMVLVGNPGLPADDLKALIAHLKAHPGKMSYASYSAGTVSHYAGVIFNQKIGTDMQHIPFAGSPPALQQVMGGQIPIMFDGIVTSTPQIKGGKLKAYGVASKTRSAHLPNVPTMSELGFPELDFSNWLGVVASSTISADMSSKINAAVLKAASAPAVKDRLAAAGFEPNQNLSSAELSHIVKTDFDRNAAIVKQFDIKLQ